MAEAEQSSLKTYRGNCHCGAFVYEVELPEIKSAAECNCSICLKKGYLHLFPLWENFKIVKGDEETLKTYTFGPGAMLHKFCPTCATPVMVTQPGLSAGKRFSLNARAIQGLNRWELERKQSDGKSRGNPYHAPEYKGPEPSAEIEHAKLYSGSCHCGGVALALKSVPLDKEYPDRVVDCNCSICERNAYVWIYPKADQVVIQGEENIARYQFANRILDKTFCKICGVTISNLQADLTDEQISALREGLREWHARAQHIFPVNLRVLN
ncbi:glutathione-dependent formaldehyde-activating enzyme, partial [Lasiosphaeris hirsuta]